MAALKQNSKYRGCGLGFQIVCLTWMQNDILNISSVIWKERNNRIFSRASKSAEQLLRSIQEEARAWILAGNRGMCARNNKCHTVE
ncbi:hypothetical protein BDA96_01G565200 [Sorghum bicolor]|uniref:Uncharacterized protein n=2 Tax=Sorghum bicolor TaxID=4558 RepID=A0A921S7Z4_SORBI|nr:hypothetical protein BDA96_01G565200 [Sorghum bicolor]OQU93369.1 hypothetical protein SORBI_3001G529301 [Sorghum bicolor]